VDETGSARTTASPRASLPPRLQPERG